jgi:hypothetical protein
MMQDKILEIISFRLNSLKELTKLVEKDPAKFPNIKIDTESRIDELESLYEYIKKME